MKWFRSRPGEDRGSILPMVFVAVVVLGAVVLSVASYTTSTLQYGGVVEREADLLAAASAAMDDAIEQLELRRSTCATAGGGTSVAFPQSINGASAEVRCSVSGGVLPATDGYAMVVTGENAPAGPTFRFTNGGEPEIGGPVWVHDVSRVAFDKVTTLREGDLWYPDTACAEAGHEIPDGATTYQRSSVTVTRLAFDPTTRGIYCLNRTWSQMFGAGPPTVTVPTTPENPAPTVQGQCTVFEPGRYTGPFLAGALGGNNYFRNGVYHLDDVGLVVLQGKAVTFGNTVAEGWPAADNSPCDYVRQTNGADGAVVYISGNTRFESRANSSLEFSRRQIGTSLVAIHVLNSTLGTTPLFTANNGAQKELAVHGLLWAPFSRLEFQTIPAQKAAVLRGGAVVGSFTGAVTAAAIGFVLEIPTAETSTQLLLESTATLGELSTLVRVVVDYRPSTGETAVRSWRVVR